MKKLQPAVLLGALGVFTSSLAFAQNYQTMPVQSGFNEDVIANGTGTSLTSTSSILDGDSYVFVARDFLQTATSTPITYGVPTNGIINSVVTTTPGLSYQLGNLSTANSLRLSNTNLTGTMVFTTPKAATKLYMLSTSGSAASTLTVTVTFTDATTQQVTGVSVPDWYGGADFAIQGLGRINRVSDGLDAAGGTNPRMYQAVLNIDAANQAKPIQSVTITKTSTTNGFPNIFAFSVDAYSTCVPPTLQPVGTITANSAAISWTAPTGSTPASYDVFYSTSSTIPASTATPNFPGVTATSLTIPSLTSNTVYYYWVRSNCSTGTSQSAWSFGGTFKTACSIFNVPYTENFDTTSTGSSTNTNAPSCWSYLETASSAGYGYVTTTFPNSSPNSYYLYNSSDNTGSQMLVSPPTTNLSSGTKRVRFYARGSSAGYTVLVGTLSNAADPTTFTPIGSAITLTATQTQYTVNIPSGTNVQLAFKHGLGGTFRGIYLDDITVESLPSCLEVTALTTSAVTANSATLSWTAPATAPGNGYEYTYTTTNTPPTVSGTTTSGTSVVVSLPAPSTTYYLWVRSKCTITDLSAWTSIAVSTKAVNDECSAPVLITPGASFTTNPVVGTTVGATSTTDATATHTCQTTGYNDTWYSVVVPASGSIKIETQSVSGSAVTDTVLGVYTGSCGTLTQVGCDDDSSTDGNFSLVTLTGQTPGATLLIGVWNYSASTSGQFRISAYDASLSTSEAVAAKKEVKVYPNPFTDIINISEFKDIKTVKVTDVAGRTLKTIENPTKEINLSSLNSGLYLITMYFKDGSQNTVKTIKK